MTASYSKFLSMSTLALIAPLTLVVPACADASSGGSAADGGILQMAVSYGPIVLIFLVFYFLLIRPQQKRQRELRTQQNSLRRGDKIVTAGGLIGVVQATREDSPEVDVEIAQNVRVKIVRSTITTVLPRDKPANDDARAVEKK